MKRKLSLVVFLLMFIAGCTKDISMKDQVFEQKLPVIKGDTILKESYINPFITKKTLQDTTYFNENYPYSDFRTLSNEQVQQDIDILFEQLKTTYGGYMAFGGEKVFNEAKTAILSGIDDSNITSADFKAWIKSNLTFIDDAHFTMNNERLRELPITYYAPEIKDEKTAEQQSNMVDFRKN